jgi:DNA gyrase subunit A
MAISSNKKALIFSTKHINEKTTKSSQGVNVLTVKNARLANLIESENIKMKNPDYYVREHIPAVGCFIKEEDSQVGFEL